MKEKTSVFSSRFAKLKHERVMKAKKNISRELHKTSIIKVN